MHFFCQNCTCNKSLMHRNRIIPLQIRFKMSLKRITPGLSIKFEMIKTKSNIKEHTFMVCVYISNFKISQKSIVIFLLSKITISKIFNCQCIWRIYFDNFLKYYNGLIDSTLFFVYISNIVHCIYVIWLKVKTVKIYV